MENQNEIKSQAFRPHDESISSDRQSFRTELQKWLLSPNTRNKQYDEYIIANTENIKQKAILCALNSLSQEVSICSKSSQQHDNNSDSFVIKEHCPSIFEEIALLYLFSLQDPTEANKKWNTYYQILNWILKLKVSQNKKKMIQQIAYHILQALAYGKTPKFLAESTQYHAFVVQTIEKNIASDKIGDKYPLSSKSRARIFHSFLCFASISIGKLIQLVRLICFGGKNEEKQLLQAIESKLFKKLYTLRKQGKSKGELAIEDLQYLCQIFGFCSKIDERASRISMIVEDTYDIENRELFTTLNAYCEYPYALQFISNELLLNFQSSKPRNQLLQNCFRRIQSNIGYFFTFLTEVYAQEQQQWIYERIFNLLQKQILRYLSISRIKSLLKLVRVNSYKHSSRLSTEKCKKIFDLLVIISKKFNGMNRMYYLQDQDTSLIDIKNLNKCKSLLFCVDFAESQEGRIIKFNTEKNRAFCINFLYHYSDSLLSFFITSNSSIKSKQNEQLVTPKQTKVLKQYQYCFIGVSINKKKSIIAFSIAGIYIEIPVNKNSLKGIDGVILGSLNGSINNIYALQTEIDVLGIHKLYEQSHWQLTEIIKNHLGFDKYLFCLDIHQIKQNKSFWNTKEEIRVTLTDAQKIRSISFFQALKQLGGIPNLLFLASPGYSLTQKFNEQLILTYYLSFTQLLLILSIQNQPQVARLWMKESLTYFSEFIWLLINKFQHLRCNTNFFRSFTSYLNWHCKLEDGDSSQFRYLMMTKVYLNMEIWSQCSTQIQQMVYDIVSKWSLESSISKKLLRQGKNQQILFGIVFFYAQANRQLDVEILKILIKIIQSISLGNLGGQINQKYLNRDITSFWSLISQYFSIIDNQPQLLVNPNLTPILLKHFERLYVDHSIIIKSYKTWPYVFYQISHLLTQFPSHHILTSSLINLAITITVTDPSLQNAYDKLIVQCLYHNQYELEQFFYIIVDLTKGIEIVQPSKREVAIEKYKEILKVFGQKSCKLPKNGHIKYEDAIAYIFSLTKPQFNLLFQQEMFTLLLQKVIKEKQYFKLGAIIFDRIIKYSLYQSLSYLLKKSYRWILFAISHSTTTVPQHQESQQTLSIEEQYEHIAKQEYKLFIEYNKAHRQLIEKSLRNQVIFYKVFMFTGCKQLLQICKIFQIFDISNDSTQESTIDIGILFLLGIPNRIDLINFLSVFWLNYYTESQYKNRAVSSINSFFFLPSYLMSMILNFLLSIKAQKEEEKQIVLAEIKNLCKLIQNLYRCPWFARQYLLLRIIFEHHKEYAELISLNKVEELSKLKQKIEQKYHENIGKIGSHTLRIGQDLYQIVKQQRIQSLPDFNAFIKDNSSEIKEYHHKLRVILDSYQSILKATFSHLEFTIETSSISSKSAHKKDNKKLIKVSDIEFYRPYTNFLKQKVYQMCRNFEQSTALKEKQWQRLAQENMFWDLTKIRDNECYEVDPKLTEYYRLNIRKAKFQEIPYPRRQSFKLGSVFQNTLADQISIKKSLTDFVTNYDEVEEQIQQQISEKTKSIKSSVKDLEYFICSYITQKGVYAGRLYINTTQNFLLFQSTGFNSLPDQLVYKYSTIFHRIEDTDFSIKILFTNKSEVFVRRYILRHTAFEIFNEFRSFFFNFFKKETLDKIFRALSSKVVCITDLRGQFLKRRFTQRWINGSMDNFQYLMTVNKFSGRTFHDLGQYPIFPWVLTNFSDNQFEPSEKIVSDPSNYRDLSLPPGKISKEKFDKLKIRCMQIDPSDFEIRFLYGTMYSNPTVLYNFFIRLQPFTTLHWDHQGKKIDHADRLFSSIREQFSTVQTSSSDNKELTPQFYYWPQFLKNRNKVDLGIRQNKEQVHAVRLPGWASDPEQFIFRMRQALESFYATEQLHEWIDLTFGYKNPYDVAEKYDNLYHFRCYEQDIFQQQNEEQVRGAQISISQFGQVPYPIFLTPHPPKKGRGFIQLDKAIEIRKQSNDIILEFTIEKFGIVLTQPQSIQIIQADLALINGKSPKRNFNSRGLSTKCIDHENLTWYSLKDGIFYIHNKKNYNYYDLSAHIYHYCTNKYLVFGIHSKLLISKIHEGNKLINVHSFYGHKSKISLIRTSSALDIVVSADEDGLVMVHQFQRLRLLRQFQIGKTFEIKFDNKIKLTQMLIHEMGYFIFLTHDQTLIIYTFLGELYLEQEIALNPIKGFCEKITNITILQHNSSILLLSTDQGRIYETDFIEIKRFSINSPYKIYSRIKNNVLEKCESPTKKIKQTEIVVVPGSTNLTYRMFVLYDNGLLTCFIESGKLTQQIKQSPFFSNMGLF